MGHDRHTQEKKNAWQNVGRKKKKICLYTYRSYDQAGKTTYLKTGNTLNRLRCLKTAFSVLSSSSGNLSSGICADTCRQDRRT